MKLKIISILIGFGIFPIISLYKYNQNFIHINDIFRPIVISIAMNCLLYIFLLKVFQKNKNKALLMTVIINVLFFSYGHIYQASGIFRHRFLIPVWVCICILGYLQIRKTSKVSPKIIDFVTSTGIIFLLISLFQISTSLIIPSVGHQVQEMSKHESPDIYYIVADGYAREDVLMHQFNFDNTPFIHELEEKGFYIAGCSLANYSWTLFSVTATLNLDYLESTNDAYHDALNDAYIWDILKEHGYTTIILENDYSRTKVIDSDIYIKGLSSKDKSRYEITDFEFVLIETSAALILTEAFETVSDSIYNQRYEITTALISNLKLIPDLYGSPKFVYAHIMTPHKPYIFSPEGELIPEEQDMETGYINSVKFVNSELLSIVDSILSTSPEPPIIIIQSDHGWPKSHKESRMPILNAFYLPPESKMDLYENITPVNTFRLLFNAHFETNFDILEDISYYTNNVHQDITEGEIINNNCSYD